MGGDGGGGAKISVPERAYEARAATHYELLTQSGIEVYPSRSIYEQVLPSLAGAYGCGIRPAETIESQRVTERCSRPSALG